MEQRAGTTWLRTPATVVLACYWLALYVGTHLPNPPAIPLQPSDKLLHVVAYAGLALLVSLNWSLRRPLGWRRGVAVLVLLAAFAVFDELTQILVGRTCDFYDWLADVVGVLIGLALFWSLAAIYRRSNEQPRHVT